MLPDIPPLPCGTSAETPSFSFARFQQGRLLRAHHWHDLRRPRTHLRSARKSLRVHPGGCFCTHRLPRNGRRLHCEPALSSASLGPALTPSRCQIWVVILSRVRSSVRGSGSGIQVSYGNALWIYFASCGCLLFSILPCKPFRVSASSLPETRLTRTHSQSSPHALLAETATTKRLTPMDGTSSPFPMDVFAFFRPPRKTLFPLPCL